MQWLVFSGIALFPWVVLMSRKEKSLSHVAMVAKFLDDIKPKTSLKKWTGTVPTSSILSNFIIQFRDVTLLLNLIKMPVFDLRWWKTDAVLFPAFH